jgi:hypothetical protein
MSDGNCYIPFLGVALTHEAVALVAIEPLGVYMGSSVEFSVSSVEV